MTSDARLPAELFPRLVSRLIDVVIAAALSSGLGVVMDFGFIWLVLGAALILAYFVVLDVWFGATVGKLLLGLRVVGPGGAKPTPRQAVIREAFTAVGALPFVGPFLALGAWIWIAVTIRSSADRRGKHDELAGGTQVVRVRA